MINSFAQLNGIRTIILNRKFSFFTQSKLVLSVNGTKAWTTLLRLRSTHLLTLHSWPPRRLWEDFMLQVSFNFTHRDLHLIFSLVLVGFTKRFHRTSKVSKVVWTRKRKGLTITMLKILTFCGSYENISWTYLLSCPPHKIRILYWSIISGRHHAVFCRFF